MQEAARNHKPRSPPCTRHRPHCPHGGCTWKTAIACCSCRDASCWCVDTELGGAEGAGVRRRVEPCVDAGVGWSDLVGLRVRKRPGLFVGAGVGSLDGRRVGS